MSGPLRSALAQVRRVAVDAPAQTTALELLQLAAAATSGTPVDLHRDVQLAAEEAIRMLRVSGNAAPMRAARRAIVRRQWSVGCRQQSVGGLRAGTGAFQGARESRVVFARVHGAHQIRQVASVSPQRARSARSAEFLTF